MCTFGYIVPRVWRTTPYGLLVSWRVGPVDGVAFRRGGVSVSAPVEAHLIVSREKVYSQPRVVFQGQKPSQSAIFFVVFGYSVQRLSLASARKGMKFGPPPFRSHFVYAVEGKGVTAPSLPPFLSVYFLVKVINGNRLMEM